MEYFCTALFVYVATSAVTSGCHTSNIAAASGNSSDLKKGASFQLRSCLRDIVVQLTSGCMAISCKRHLQNCNLCYLPSAMFPRCVCSMQSFREPVSLSPQTLSILRWDLGEPSPSLCIAQLPSVVCTDISQSNVSLKCLHANSRGCSSLKARGLLLLHSR